MIIIKISELIAVLKYELESTGDSEVCISICTSNKHKLETHKDIISTTNLQTEIAMLKDKSEFIIKNWM